MLKGFTGFQCFLDKQKGYRILGSEFYCFGFRFSMEQRGRWHFREEAGEHGREWG